MGLTSKQIAFVRSVKTLAEAVCPEYGVPPQCAVAQAVLETGWGRSIPANNLFGVRGNGDAGSSSIPTFEVIDGKTVHQAGQKFGAYSSHEASLRAYCELVTSGPYAPAATYLPDLARWLVWVWGSGYATANRYVETLAGIIGTVGRATKDPSYTATIDRPLAAVIDAIRAVSGATKRRAVLARESKTRLRAGV